MALFFKKENKEEALERDEDLTIIDLNLTSEWERLELEEVLASTMEEEKYEAEEYESEEFEEITEIEVEITDLLGVGELEEITEVKEEFEELEEIREKDFSEYEESESPEELETEESEEEEVELTYLSDEEEKEDKDEQSPFIFFEKIGSFFRKFSTLDKIVACAGLIVILVAIITLTAYTQKSGKQEQLAAMVPVGEQLQTVGIPGRDKLVAIADARKAMLVATEPEAEEELLKEYEEKEEEASGKIQVSMKMTSVQKDLKIKFVNKKSGKLISSIPFEVAIVDGKEKKYNKIDEDKDGIIYLKDLEPGDYTVAMVEIKELEDYGYPTEKEKIKVKESIDYKKIDVSDEIKSQSEVDVAKEDTAKKQETEAVLQDTVEWIASKKEAVSSKDNYKQVNKSTISDPTLSASATDGRSLLSMITYLSSLEGSEESGEENSSHVKSISLSGEKTQLSMGESTALTAKIEKEGDPSYTIEWSTSDSELITLSGSGETANITVVKEPELDSTVTVTVRAGGQEASISLTIKGKPKDTTLPVTKIELNVSTFSLEIGNSFELKVTVSPQEATNKQYTWSVDDSSIIKLENGVVTALKEGTAKITVISQADNNIKAECIVTVQTNASLTVQLDKSEVTLKPGATTELKVNVTPEGKTVKWQSSKKEVAAVDDKGKVTAVAAGEAVITAEVEGVQAKCKITVSTAYDPKTDNSKTLKDKSGNQIYVKVNGKYTEAKVADYYKYTEFYIKETVSEYRYFGWQNLDGKTYFFDKNGNKVTGEQVIQGAKYTFNSDGSLNTGSGILGIDVSTWNGNINWSQVKNSGVSYVIIRTGFRGSTQGALVEDNKFRQNIKGATEAGLKVGVYFFTQAINEVEAVEEASMVLSQIKGYKISYPVFIDVESSGGRADGLDAGTRTRVINAFCQTIQNGGYRAGIYANKTWLAQKMNLSALSGYKIWLAQYNTHVTYGGRYDMWQYSDKGSVPGISGKVDMNLSYMSY